MNLAALFMKGIEPEGVSHVCDGNWTDAERDVIDPLMTEWCEEWLSPGFNTWLLWKSDYGYFAKRFTWDNFDINSQYFNEFVDKLRGYYERY